MASQAMRFSWLDRVTTTFAPRWTLSRVRARAAVSIMRRHYEAAGAGRRTQGWNRTGADANAAVGPALSKLRAAARDLVRNNPYAESALSTIADHAVGTGIVASLKKKNDRALEAWKAWAETTDCDADGRHDFYGLQKLVMRTVVESGEVLIRRRPRLPGDGFAIPMQIQVLDPDFLDTLKDQITLPNGGRIVQGIEFDPIGRRAAYWLFQQHPGSNEFPQSMGSVRVPAEFVRHVFRPMRPGQVRGPSWFAPVLLRFKDFEEYEDATLMKQKIAACLAVITSDAAGSGPPLGETTTDDPTTDTLAPGMILNVPSGRTVDVVSPPSVGEYSEYAKSQLRAIATGLGVNYEDLTGDYGSMPFSAARMSRLRHWARVEDWRWRILIPQFCVPVWAWMNQAATIANLMPEGLTADWTAPPPPMVDPDKEGLAYLRLIRTGLMSLSEAIRERGYDPDTLLAEIAADNSKLDALGIVLDSDPRHMTAQGQAQAVSAVSANQTDPTGTAASDDEGQPVRGWVS